MPNFNGSRLGYWFIRSQPTSPSPKPKTVLLVGETITDWRIKPSLSPINPTTFDFYNINNYEEIFQEFNVNGTPTNLNTYQFPMQGYNQINRAGLFWCQRDYRTKSDIDYIATKLTTWFENLGYQVTYRKSYQELVDNETSTTLLDYSQIWDLVFLGKADFGPLGEGLNTRGPKTAGRKDDGDVIHYRNIAPLAVKNLYIDYLKAGGSMLFLGENKGSELPQRMSLASARNVSIMLFIEELGGGQVSASNFIPGIAKGNIDNYFAFMGHSLDYRNDGGLTQNVVGGGQPYSTINPEFLISNDVPGYYMLNPAYFHAGLYTLNRLGNGTPFTYFTAKSRGTYVGPTVATRTIKDEEYTYVSSAIWKKGSLSNAPNGTLMTIFDTDFISDLDLSPPYKTFREFYKIYDPKLGPPGTEDRLFFENIAATLQTK